MGGILSFTVLYIIDAFLSRQDKLAQTMWMEIEPGSTHPEVDVLQWLFAICIGKADGLSLETGDKELFNTALDSVRDIAKKEGSGLKALFTDL